MSRAGLTIALLAACVSPGALADDYSADVFPLEVINRPITLPHGMVETTLGATANLSTGALFQPTEPAVTIGYGVTNGFTLTGNFDLCLNGNGACPSAAGSAGIAGSFLIDRSDAGAMALTLGFELPAFKPRAEMAIPLGLLFRYKPTVVEFFAIVVNPQFIIALTDRNTTQFDRFLAPFALQFQIIPHLELEATVSFSVPIETANAANQDLIGAIGVGGRYAFTNLIDLGASFAFTNLLGKGASQGTSGSAANLFFAYRF